MVNLFQFLFFFMPIWLPGFDNWDEFLIFHYFCYFISWLKLLKAWKFTFTINNWVWIVRLNFFELRFITTLQNQISWVYCTFFAWEEYNSMNRRSMIQSLSINYLDNDLVIAFVSCKMSFKHFSIFLQYADSASWFFCLKTHSNNCCWKLDMYSILIHNKQPSVKRKTIICSMLI